MGAMEYLQDVLERVWFVNWRAGCRNGAQSIVVTVVLAVMMLMLVVRLQRPRRKLPPSPAGAWPIVGHFALLGKQPHVSMANLANKYGAIYSLRLGSIPAIVVSSPELAREVLQVQDKAWASRPTRLIQAEYFSYNHKGISFAQYTPMWRLLRKIATLELFTAKRLEASHALREEEMQHMIRSIMQNAKLGTTVNVKSKLSMMVGNQIFRMVLNRRLSGEEGDQDAESLEFRYIVQEMQQKKGLFMPGDFVSWLRPFDIGGIEKHIKAVQRRWDAFLDKVLHEHEEKQGKGAIAESDKDMVDVLLHTMHTQDPKESVRLDVDNIKATVMSILAAGVDTSIVTTEWGMSELVRNPHVLQKLTSELDAVVGRDRMVQETDIPKLKYLQAVIKEVFRLHPPAPLLLPHESLQDTQISGYHVPAGTRLFIHVHAMGRSPAVWTNPLEFDPERFVNEPEIDLRGTDFRLIPFGSGRRACPAITLGTVSVQWTTAMLVQAFEWSLHPGESCKDLDMTETFGITTARASPLILHATPRLRTQLYTA
ncbi:hypothetical protein M758_3G022900 [Ceratodon purpureus]|nr:hypothetical protein M758_3G022900 [Ceratodon purpureus]